VIAQFLKNPDITHWGFAAHWLGQDEWGDWIGVPTGTTRWKGETEVRPSRTDAVFCVPRGSWWHLHFTGTTTNFSHFVDIVTPPVWVSPNRYEMIDLDLDVVRTHDGVVAVEDEDEFEVNQVRYAYPDELIRGAVEETARVVEMLDQGEEPFFAVAASWLAQLH
jgi:hypothetical protein